ncbi:uncharacterized protein [Gossypium hirsutum]|uniref:CCHC-type domain-containing protein n=1 Tax=Gossypium hirsutum TaxID=3635 RepID=A0ABM3A9V2_GOSHI|nr:uncharacterized protein LOC121218473 [Gossypium hirsutum]
MLKTTYQNKYVGASYIEARRQELLNVTQGDCSVVEYEAEFIRLSRYARGMVATEYERCVRFEDGLRDSLRVLIAPQRERDFSALVEKAKIAEEVKRSERQNREKRKAKWDFEPSNTGMRPKKKARTDGPLCNRYYPRECWRATGACLRCGSTEHRVKDCPLRSNQMQAPIVETAQP